jgi:hypothetical protein
MRLCIIGAAALAALAGCSQSDQKLPFEFESTAPVVRTMGAGATVVSTPAGLSMTMPAGALPAGSGMMLAKLDRQAHLAGGPPLAGDLYLIGFEGAPRLDPGIEFSFAMDQATTAGGLVGLVPVIFRVPVPGRGQGAVANLRPAGTASFQSDGGAGDDAQSKFEALLAAGIFHGIDGAGDVNAGVSGARLAGIISNLFDTSREARPTSTFTDLPSGHWSAGYIEALTGLNGSIEPRYDDVGRDPRMRNLLLNSFISGLQGLGPGSRGTIDSVQNSWSDGAHFYAISAMLLSHVPVRPRYPEPVGGTPSSHPLIPLGATSATFELICTAIEWPSAAELPLCDGKVIDVRAGEELLERFPASVVVPNYLRGKVMLQLGGLAAGSLEYDLFLRTVLATGITGLELEDDLALAGTWSASGDTLTIGGHRFQYSVPDANSLVLVITDSVRIKDRGGAESWQRLQAHLKLRRR